MSDVNPGQIVFIHDLVWMVIKDREAMSLYNGEKRFIKFNPQEVISNMRDYSVSDLIREWECTREDVDNIQKEYFSYDQLRGGMAYNGWSPRWERKTYKAHFPNKRR